MGEKRMKKINDWFVAGVIAGAIGGAGILLLNVVLLLLGIEHGTYWQAMGGLFFNKQLLQTWVAQVHGALDATGVSAVNGVLLSLTLLITGKDYLYTKSVVLSAFGAYFLFLAVYPQTGLGKDSLITPWVALFGHTFSNGLLTGYILDKICSFDKEPQNEIAQDSPLKLRRFALSPGPARKQLPKAQFVKPKKL